MNSPNLFCREMVSNDHNLFLQLRWFECLFTELHEVDDLDDVRFFVHMNVWFEAAINLKLAFQKKKKKRKNAKSLLWNKKHFLERKN